MRVVSDGIINRVKAGDTLLTIRDCEVAGRHIPINTKVIVGSSYYDSGDDFVIEMINGQSIYPSLYPHRLRKSYKNEEKLWAEPQKTWKLLTTKLWRAE